MSSDVGTALPNYENMFKEMECKYMSAQKNIEHLTEKYEGLKKDYEYLLANDSKQLRTIANLEGQIESFKYCIDNKPWTRMMYA